MGTEFSYNHGRDGLEVALSPAEIREIRQKLNMTQARLAAVLGVSIRAVRYWEAGSRRIPGPVNALLRLLLRVPEPK